MNIVTFGLGIMVAAPALAESADEAAVDTQVENQTQLSEAVTEAQETTIQLHPSRYRRKITKRWSGW
ncbi:MAG: hypothetical protein WBQ78_09840 [Gammaproteobacteria bacterium]